MLIQDFLTLTLIKLKTQQDWEHKPEGLSFLFLKQGPGKFTHRSASHRLSAGDVLVLHGDTRGKLSLENGAEVVFWTFSLNLEHLFPLFAANEISFLQDVAEDLKTPRLLGAQTPIAAQCHRLIEEVPPKFSLDHRAQVLRIASLILGEHFKTAQQQRAGYVRVEEHLVQVFEKLSADDLINLSVFELASRFGCSRRHLNRLFHQYFGYSVASLRMEMRLLKAVSLLRDPDAKIINVAEKCGFNHLGLFNTCFKRRFGTSPGQWRKAFASNMELSKKSSAAPLSGAESCPLLGDGLCPWNQGSQAVALPGPAALLKKPCAAPPAKTLPPAQYATPEALAIQQKLKGAGPKRSSIHPNG